MRRRGARRLRLVLRLREDDHHRAGDGRVPEGRDHVHAAGRLVGRRGHRAPRRDRAGGQATVAIWRYPRTETLPKTKLELQAARDALVDASLKRDATFEKIKTAATTIAGAPAVQIRAREQIAGQPRTVRSTHIYADGAEYVIDAYADADSFRAVDAKVFRPLLRSVHVSSAE